MEQGVLYISLEYKTAAHKCCCGCGNKVVTPLLPTDWTLHNHGATVSLHPSIGNWSFDCKSHYLIKRNRVVWCGQWSEKRIEAGRARDLRIKKNYYEPSAGKQTTSAQSESRHAANSGSLLGRILRFFGWRQ
ncbi:DUF6527 family protein [Desulfuromonas acetoxidans]|uniref:DUF6527 family protein n=1 Tax=Desulfuromonas acetoxidans TaxID=891 RepID=UPI00374916E4